MLIRWVWRWRNYLKKIQHLLQELMRLQAKRSSLVWVSFTWMLLSIVLDVSLRWTQTKDSHKLNTKKLLRKKQSTEKFTKNNLEVVVNLQITYSHLSQLKKVS